MTFMDSLRLGLALGGGTARASAHVGVLKVLERRGVKPRLIAGTSAGAMLAALHALGLSAAELEHIVTEPNVTRLWRSAVDPGWRSGGLIHGSKFERYINERYFHEATFADIITPLKIACTDVDTGELVLVQSGSLARAIRASSAFPIMVAPTLIEGRYLADGGLVATVPFAALQDEALDMRVGVHAGVDVEASTLVKQLRRFYRSRFGKRLSDLPERLRSRYLKTLAGGAAQIVGSYQQRVEAPEDMILLRTWPNIAWWSFERSSDAVAAGELAARDMLDDLLTPLPASSATSR